MRSLLGVCTLIGVGLLPAMTLAQDAKVRNAITETELQTLVQNAGYKAVIASDANGSYIDSSASGQTFYLGLYGCDESTPKQCNIIGYQTATFSTTPEIAKAKALEWNNSIRWWARVSLDAESKPSLVSNVDLNGVTDDNIVSTLNDFIADIGEFQKMIAQ